MVFFYCEKCVCLKFIVALQLVSTILEIVGVAENEMLTHSATNREAIRSGMREHFDEHAIDFVFSSPSMRPHQNSGF